MALRHDNYEEVERGVSEERLMGRKGNSALSSGYISAGGNRELRLIRDLRRRNVSEGIRRPRSNVMPGNTGGEGCAVFWRAKEDVPGRNENKKNLGEGRTRRRQGQGTPR